MHEYIPVVVTLVAILIGILMNRADVNQLRAEMKAEIKEVRSELQSLRSEMNHHFDRVDERFTKVDYSLMQFFTITGKQEGRIDEIAKRA